MCLMVVLVVGVVAVDAVAQRLPTIRGEVTDEWGNALEDVQIVARKEGADPREDTTNDKGRYNLVNVPSGEYIIEFRAPGYQPVDLGLAIEQSDALFRQPPIKIELAAFPAGSRLRSDTEFGTEDGSITLTLKDDGRFEFEFEDDEGEGTYGILDQEGFLTVRDYDGDDDKFSITEPVVVRFATPQLKVLTWGDATLKEQ